MNAEEIEKLAETIERCPGREWHEGRLESEARFAEGLDDAQKIRASMILCQTIENRIIDRFDGTGDEEAARVAQGSEVGAMMEEMLDFDRDVIGERRKFAMESCDERQCVANAIEKIGVTKCDMRRSGRNLLPNVVEDNIARDDAEYAVVNRHDRAMSAKMLAAAA